MSAPGSVDWNWAEFKTIVFFDNTLQTRLTKPEVPMRLTLGDCPYYGYYYPKEAIKGFEQYYRQSTSEPEEDNRIGTIVFMDIKVGPNVIEKGAWYVQEPKTGFEDFLDQIAFRVKWKGDSGFGLKPTGLETGVAIDENWFG